MGHWNALRDKRQANLNSPTPVWGILAHSEQPFDRLQNGCSAELCLANLQVGCVDPRVVMQIIGWSQPSTIMRYLETRLGYPSPSIRSMS